MILSIHESLLKVFIILTDAKSLFTMKSKVKLMQTIWDFPSAKDEKKVTDTICSFLDGEKASEEHEYLIHEVCCIDWNSDLASVKATEAIFDQIQNIILPQMQDAAKSAFQDAAKKYVSSQKTSIIETALILIVDQEKAREKIAKAKKEAIKRGTEAAKKAAEDKKQALMPEVHAKAKELTKAAVQSNKDAVKMLIKIAVEDVKKKLKNKWNIPRSN